MPACTVRRRGKFFRLGSSCTKHAFEKNYEATDIFRVLSSYRNPQTSGCCTKKQYRLEAAASSVHLFLKSRGSKTTPWRWLLPTVYLNSRARQARTLHGATLWPRLQLSWCGCCGSVLLPPLLLMLPRPPGERAGVAVRARCLVAAVTSPSHLGYVLRWRGLLVCGRAPATHQHRVPGVHCVHTLHAGCGAGCAGRGARVFRAARGTALTRRRGCGARA